MVVYFYPMMRKIISLLILCFLSVAVVSAQDNSPLARARKLQRLLAYHDAIPLYQKALEHDSLNKEALRGIAECYRMTAQTELAAVYYLKLVGDTASTSSDKFRTAQVLMSNGDYDAAKKYFDAYAITSTGDERAKNSLEAINRMEEFLRDSTLYTISDPGINSGQSEFSPAPFATNGYVFVSSRASG